MWAFMSLLRASLPSLISRFHCLRQPVPDQHVEKRAIGSTLSTLMWMCYATSFPTPVRTVLRILSDSSPARGAAAAMFFSCFYLTHREFKVYPKLPGDKFRAWELRYLDDCLVGSEQRRFQIFLSRWHNCFQESGVEKPHDHFLNTSHGAKLKRIYQTSGKAETNKKPRLHPGLPIADGPSNSVCTQPSIPPVSCPGSGASSSQLLPMSVSPASSPASEPSGQTHAHSLESTGLEFRIMSERCGSTLAVLLMLQHSATSSRSKKAKPARDCIVTLLRHCFQTYSCQDLIHEACRLLNQSHHHQLMHGMGDPSAFDAHHFCDLVLRLRGVALGALLTSAAAAIDNAILHTLEPTKVGSLDKLLVCMMFPTLQMRTHLLAKGPGAMQNFHTWFLMNFKQSHAAAAQSCLLCRSLV